MKKTEPKTIDCTPTWEGILPLMLDLYVQHYNSGKPGSHEHLKNMEQEFKKMAKAADAHNAQIKAMQGK